MFYRGAELRHKIKRQKEWSFILLHDDRPFPPKDDGWMEGQVAGMFVRYCGLILSP